MISFQEISQQLDRMFFESFKEGETVELRSQAIQAYIEANGWNWDSYLEADWMRDKN